jgi:hypothetical protein
MHPSAALHSDDILSRSQGLSCEITYIKLMSVPCLLLHDSVISLCFSCYQNLRRLNLHSESSFTSEIEVLVLAALTASDQRLPAALVIWRTLTSLPCGFDIGCLAAASTSINIPQPSKAPSPTRPSSYKLARAYPPHLALHTFCSRHTYNIMTVRGSDVLLIIVGCFVDASRKRRLTSWNLLR